MKYVIAFFSLCYTASGLAQTPFEYGRYNQNLLCAYIDTFIYPGKFSLHNLETQFSSDSFFISVHASMISDKYGELQFLSNENQILDKYFNPMDNGQGLNPQLNYGDWYQAQLALPYPEQDSIYILFNQHRYINYAGSGAEIDGLSYSLIDMAQNNGLGKVTLKNEPLIQDSLQYGGLVTCRHANGRDWWIIQPRVRGRIYYRYLLTPQGVLSYPPLEFTEGYNIPNTVGGFGNSTFSPDGTKYARIYDTYNYTGINGLRLEVHDFDRCTGEFTNFTEQYIPSTAQTFSTATCIFSPNSEYLYIMDIYHIMRKQVDNIMGTMDTLVTINWHPTDSTYNVLGSANTGFDGRFYFPSRVLISYDGGATNKIKGYLSVLDNPDSPTPVFYENLIPTVKSILINPYTTNFRLGPADGTACDTLGIDAVNIPWEVINLPLGVEEGHSSGAGIFKVYPNPTTNQLLIDGECSTATLYNLTGQLVLSTSNKQLYLGNLPHGMYVLCCYDAQGKVIHREKVIKQ